jgi:hypothetical protein
MAPIKTNGSTMLYEQVIRKYFIKNQKKIDAATKEMAANAKKAAGVVIDAVSESGGDAGYAAVVSEADKSK